MNRPVVTAEITFLTEDEGGKYCPPVFGTSSYLRGRDAKVAADLSREVVRDFVVAWHGGSLSVGRVAPP